MGFTFARVPVSLFGKTAYEDAALVQSENKEPPKTHPAPIGRVYFSPAQRCGKSTGGET